MDLLPMKLLERFKLLTVWNKIGVIGGIASTIGIPLAILLYSISGERPVSLPELESRAYRLISEKDFNSALATFDKLIAIDARRSRYWEGKAYAYLGLIYEDDLEVYGAGIRIPFSWFDLDPVGQLSNHLTQASYCAGRAIETAISKRQKARATQLKGLTLQLAGWNYYVPNHLRPMPYYLHAYDLIENLPMNERRRRNPHFSNDSESIMYAIAQRVRTFAAQYGTESCKTWVRSYESISTEEWCSKPGHQS